MRYYIPMMLACLLSVPKIAAQGTESALLSPDSIVGLESSKMLGGDASEPGAVKFILTRDECVRIALETNPTIRVADMEVKRMDWSKKETRASLWPSLDFSGSYQRTIELQTMRMSMGGMSQTIKMGSDNSWNFGFTAAMPLVNPTLWKAIQVSQTQIEQSLESARASRLDMVNQVDKAYYALLLAVASREVIKANYDIAVFNAGLYHKQFQAGTASEYDVLRADVQVRNIEPDMLQADISVKQSELMLKVLMGLELDVVVEPAVTLADMQQEMYGYLMTASESSLADNTDMRSLELSQKMANQNVTLKKFAYIPTLATQFNLSWMSISDGNALKNQDFSPYSNVALSLQVPLLSGGSRFYGIKGAKLQAAELALQKEYLESSLRTQVSLALDNINREAKQIESSKEGMRQAAKALDIMQKSFEIGAASYLQLRDAEIANTTARLSYYQSIYNYLVSASDLDKLLGREFKK